MSRARSTAVMAPGTGWRVLGATEQPLGAAPMSPRQAENGAPNGSPSRFGKVWKVYPYSLRSLEEALWPACWRSVYNGPHVLAVVAERQSTVIRRYEGGRQVHPPPGA